MDRNMKILTLFTNRLFRLVLFTRWFISLALQSIKWRNIKRLFCRRKATNVFNWDEVNFTDPQRTDYFLNRFDVEQLMLVDKYNRTVLHPIMAKGEMDSFELIEKRHPKLIPHLLEKIIVSRLPIPLEHILLLNTRPKILLDLMDEYGFDPLVKNREGMTALMHCVMVNHRYPRYFTRDNIVFCFLFGINVNERNVYGETALHLAVKRGNIQAVKLLLRLGADSRIRNVMNQSPLDLAQQTFNQDIYSILAGQPVRLSFRKRIRWFWGYIRHSWPNRIFYLRYITGWILLLCLAGVTLGFMLPIYVSHYISQVFHVFIIYNLAIIVIAICLLAVFIRFVFGDPGFYPTNTYEYNKYIDTLIQVVQSKNEKLIGKAIIDYIHLYRDHTLCHICECICQLSGKHCYYCGRCMEKYDHHCVFLLNCVAKRSFNYFILFCFLFICIGALGIRMISYLIMLDPRKEAAMDQIWNLFANRQYLTASFGLLRLSSALRTRDFSVYLFCLQYIILGIIMSLASLCRKYFNKPRCHVLWSFEKSIANCPNLWK